MKQRDNTIDILKGMGITLMVVGHAGCPQVLHDYIYTFHMPLFFIASGYFFSTKDIENKAVFFLRKIKGIYIPFILCSLSFLFLHNLFFKVGIINDAYGATNGYVSHLYSYKEIAVSAFNILFRMDRYECFLLGAYWFMRALFFSSLILCFGTWLLNKLLKSVDKSILVLSIVCLLSAGFLKYTHIHIPYIAQGGYREMIGVFFMCVGYMTRKNIVHINKYFTVIVALIISVFLYIVHPASLELSSTFIDWLIIPFSGISGTYLILWLATKWSDYKSSGIVAYMGQKSIWILTLHLIAFKLSELLEISIYDLPIKMVGCHTIIPPLDNWFFLIHTICGVSIPLLCAYSFSQIKGCVSKE